MYLEFTKGEGGDILKDAGLFTYNPNLYLYYTSMDILGMLIPKILKGSSENSFDRYHLEMILEKLIKKFSLKDHCSKCF